MPLVIPAVAGLVVANLASTSIHGISAPQLGLGIATGFCIYAQTGMTVVTVDVGTLGAGAGIGQGIILPPPALIGPMIASFAGSVIAGIMSAPTATAIGNALSQALALASIITVHSTVGIGTGVAKIIPNPGVSVPSFLAGFAGAGLIGIFSAPMATAIATALDIAILSALGVVVIAGPGSPIPSGGGGVGKLL